MQRQGIEISFPNESPEIFKTRMRSRAARALGDWLVQYLMQRPGLPFAVRVDVDVELGLDCARSDVWGTCLITERWSITVNPAQTMQLMFVEPSGLAEESISCRIPSPVPRPVPFWQRVRSHLAFMAAEVSYDGPTPTTRGTNNAQSP